MISPRSGSGSRSPKSSSSLRSSSSPRSSSSRSSSSPRSSSSLRNQGLDSVNEDSADENMLEQFGNNILKFINRSRETGEQKVKNIASFVRDKIKEMTSVEKMTSVESFFNGQIQASPSDKQKLELTKLKYDTKFIFLETHNLSFYNKNEQRIILNKVKLVKSAVEYHYDKIKESLTQLQRFRVIENAMSAAIDYIKKNETDFLIPHNINSKYQKNVDQVVHDAIMSAQSKFIGGRKNPTKGRPKKPRSSRKPRSTRKK